MARILQEKNRGQVIACFLGYADITVEQKFRETKAHSEGARDWLLNESDEYIRHHIHNMVEYSRKVEQQCAQEGVQYFDTSSDFVNTVNRATQYLLTGV